MRQIRQHYQNALEQLTCSFFTWVPVAVLLAIAVVHIQKDLKQRASYWRAATFTETAARVRRLDVSPDGLLSLQQLCGQQEPCLLYTSLSTPGTILINIVYARNTDI